MPLEVLDKEELVRKRQRRAIASSLSDFEALIEPHLPKTPEMRRAIKAYKDAHRKMIEDLATDAIDLMGLVDGIIVNGEAQHIADVLRLRPREARPEDKIGAVA